MWGRAPVVRNRREGIERKEEGKVKGKGKREEAQQEPGPDINEKKEEKKSEGGVMMMNRRGRPRRAGAAASRGKAGSACAVIVVG